MSAVKRQTAGGLLAAFAVMWFVVLSLVALSTKSAFVFSDEAGYFLPMLFGAEPTNYERWSILGSYPSYLYFAIYSLLPSNELHSAVKILNAGFIAATAFPAYALAKRFLTPRWSAIFAAVVILSPISTFVRYIMPEPLFFFGFWMTLWILFASLERSVYVSATASGFMIGLLSLVKPHALAIAIGLSAFFVLREKFKLRGILSGAIQMATFYLTHLIAKWILTGTWFLSLTGSTYGGMLSGRQVIWEATGFNLLGHLVALVVVIGIPLEIAILLFCRTGSVSNGASSHHGHRDLALVACCVLAASLAMTVFYSQIFFQIAPETEKITRLHGRYYLYIFPLFWLFLLALWERGASLDIRPVIIKNFYIFALLILVANFIIRRVFEVGPIDYVDLSWIGVRFKSVIFLLAVLLIGYWGLSRLRTQRLTLLVISAAGWWVTLSLVTSAALLRSHFQGGAIDAVFIEQRNSEIAGIVGRSDGIIVGTAQNPADVFRCMFYLRSLSAGKILGSDQTFTDLDFPNNAKWALLLPSVVYAGSAKTTHVGMLRIVKR